MLQGCVMEYYVWVKEKIRGSKLCHSNLFAVHLEEKTANEDLLNFLDLILGIFNLWTTNSVTP